ncbi:RidA family protein [Colwellia piezophila]|uniref:RidA family protein n=1 Tax=Colwellia piezophila TaxID=211668 RepID=UPI00037A1F4C|nr:RidA family protein [Colwellia piezophila]
MILNFKLILIVAISILLSANSTAQTVERKNYYSWENDYGYSQVVRAGNTLYISGIASDKATFPEQMKEIYKVINKILADYGVNSDAIVKQVIYTTDIEKMKAYTELRKTFFNKDKYPSSSIVQVSRLYEKGHLLEVEIVAVIPKI